jgi:hypothetical protein
MKQTTYLTVIFSLVFFYGCINLDYGNNTNQDVCKCVSKIEINDSSLNLKFGNCLKIYLEGFIKENGFNHIQFKSDFPEFLESISQECPSFMEIAEIWFSHEGNYITGIKPEQLMKLRKEQCDSLKTINWTYRDQFEGEIIFYFNPSHFQISNPNTKAYSNYLITENKGCSLDFELKETTNPFNLIIPQKVKESIYLLNTDGIELIVLYEVDKGVFKEIRLKPIK